MKMKKPIYCSPKLEIVPFDDEDILTVSTYGTNEGDNEGTGTGSEIDFGDLGWT